MEGSVLSNTALNTIYFKDHSDNERNLLPPFHGLLFLISHQLGLMCTFKESCYSTHLTWTDN